jgi:regulator of RNase E activity RraA
VPIGYRVHRNIDRPDPDLVQEIGKHFTPDLADAMQKSGAMSKRIHAIYSPIPRIAGPAVTASLPTGSFSMAKLAMTLCEPGDVLVLNAYGDVSHALVGGHIAQALQVRGLAGMIVDGAVRDTSELREIGFPVFARGTAIIVGGHDGPGEINVPVACGNVVVNPGDIVVADEDGIVVVPQNEVDEVLSRVSSLHESHLAATAEFESGTIPGMDDVRARMEAAGCEFI